MIRIPSESAAVFRITIGSIAAVAGLEYGSWPVVPCVSALCAAAGFFTRFACLGALLSILFGCPDFDLGWVRWMPLITALAALVVWPCDARASVAAIAARIRSAADGADPRIPAGPRDSLVWPLWLTLLVAVGSIGFISTAIVFWHGFETLGAAWSELSLRTMILVAVAAILGIRTWRVWLRLPLVAILAVGTLEPTGWWALPVLIPLTLTGLLRMWSRMRLWILYDHGCSLCRKALALLLSLDWGRRIQALNVRDWETVQRHFPNLDEEQCLKDMHSVDSKGRVAMGYESYQRIAWRLPLFVAFAWVLYLPPVARAGRRRYRYIADMRLMRECGDEYRPRA